MRCFFFVFLFFGWSCRMLNDQNPDRFGTECGSQTELFEYRNGMEYTNESEPTHNDDFTKCQLFSRWFKWNWRAWVANSNWSNFNGMANISAFQHQTFREKEKKSIRKSLVLSPKMSNNNDNNNNKSAHLNASQEHEQLHSSKDNNNTSDVKGGATQWFCAG